LRRRSFSYPKKTGFHLAEKILGSLPALSGAMESEDILAEATRRDAELESGAIEALTEQAFWDGVRRRNS
jgi:hypothetical protein